MPLPTISEKGEKGISEGRERSQSTTRKEIPWKDRRDPTLWNRWSDQLIMQYESRQAVVEWFKHCPPDLHVDQHVIDYLKQQHEGYESVDSFEPFLHKYGCCVCEVEVTGQQAFLEHLEGFGPNSHTAKVNKLLDKGASLIQEVRCGLGSTNETFAYLDWTQCSLCWYKPTGSAPVRNWQKNGTKGGQNKAWDNMCYPFSARQNYTVSDKHKAEIGLEKIASEQGLELRFKDDKSWKPTFSGTSDFQIVNGDISSTMRFDKKYLSLKICGQWITLKMVLEIVSFHSSHFNRKL